MKSMVLPSQAYELKLAPHPAPFSVLKFAGLDAVSELYRYEVEFTSPVAHIPTEKVLGRPARFIIDTIDPNAEYLRHMFGENAEKFSDMPPARTIHGVVTEFVQFETSADQTRYKLVIEPRTADLARGKKSRLFQKQSVQEIITQTLNHYGYGDGVDFKFQLRAQYKRHEYITQYHESTFAFIQRIAADEGIWFRFEQVKNREVIIFGDDLDAYARNQRTVPLRRESGLESAGAQAIKSLECRMQRVPESVQLNDYNHRQANVPLLVEANAARNDTTTNGVDSRWGEHYATPEEGQRIAQLRHEAHLAQQTTFKGEGNAFALEVGEVLKIDPNPAYAPHGLFILSVESSGGRRQAYWNTFTAIPSDRVWRTPIDPEAQPVIKGLLPARITSPGDYSRAYLTPEGWYVIKLPFDLDAWSPGGTSRPVRRSKPFSGDNYGHHFPLIDGAEVAIAFTLGDPNRPIIVGALHDSLHPDLVNTFNHTRNLIRTVAQNELRMEDRDGLEHIRLTTPFQTSELSLGHMVDGNSKERGQGAELRTDEHLAMRSGKGILISADAQPGANGKQMDMESTRKLLEQALEQMEELAAAAKSARAGVADLAAQREVLDNVLKRFEYPAVVMSAPDGIGLVSGDHLQLSAGKNLIANAGGSADIGVQNNFTVAAGEAISLFAQKGGMKLFAARGKVEVQAQRGEMTLAALKDFTITSSADRIVLTAAKEVWIGAGGSYIRISANGIEYCTPGDIYERCAYWGLEPAASSPVHKQALANALPTQHVMLDAAAAPASLGSIPKGMPYKLFADGVLVKQGVIDASGQIPVDHHVTTKKYTLALAGGAT
ncbi:type VI secretion system Vgr family protein [Burkholderia sp. L27(2015)]|uniref:type VI secretion system Vgr family protein n=1 Tax=Burkholderia sp. L27(2015) TaxID=1641858 RepID=UPI00131E2BA8|nr:type VI secretion system Vgr family protein [Burkholderia sp. L27(2015)]